MILSGKMKFHLVNGLSVSNQNLTIKEGDQYIFEVTYEGQQTNIIGFINENNNMGTQYNSPSFRYSG